MRWNTLMVCVVVALLGSDSREVAAQTSDVTTILEIEILTPRIGNGLNAQRWRQVFESIGRGVRIRQPLLDDKPDLTEKSRGTFRIVKLIGRMDLDGSVHFPGRKFGLSEGAQLDEWLDELETYGAQGSPAGQPLWGLSEAQFDRVFAALGQPVTTDVTGLALQPAIEALDLPEAFPVRWHSSAKEHLATVPETQMVPFSTRGLTGGTSLAAILSQYGLGFQPLRNPSGSLALVVEPLKTVPEPWPVGWDVDPVTPRNQIVPEMFKTLDAGFEGVFLDDVLRAISRETGVPILVDYRKSDAKEIDVRKLLVSYPKKRTAWALILESVTRRSRMTSDLRSDEAGNPFYLVAPFEATIPKRK